MNKKDFKIPDLWATNRLRERRRNRLEGIENIHQFAVLEEFFKTHISVYPEGKGKHNLKDCWGQNVEILNTLPCVWYVGNLGPELGVRDCWCPQKMLSKREGNVSSI